MEEQIAQRAKYDLEVENVYYNMKYQEAFKVWKFKFCWPFYTFVSRYFNVLMNVAILIYALKYNISVIWLVFLVVYAVQTVWMQVDHRTFRKQSISKYITPRSFRDDLYTDSKKEARMEKLNDAFENTKKEAEELIIDKFLKKLDKQPDGLKRIVITDE
jgi:hypothetical protein